MSHVYLQMADTELQSSRMTSVPSNRRRRWSAILKQLGVSAGVAVTFMLYVWLIQLAYERVLHEQRGQQNWKTAALFVAVIFAGSFSYDCAKKIALLEPDAFKAFWKPLSCGVASFAGMFILFVVSAALFAYDQPSLGMVLFIAALGLEFHAVMKFSKAIDEATRG